MPALADASIAASPRVGPTVLEEISSTWSGSAPPSISSARSLAWDSLKPPEMLVPPVMLPPQGTETSGEEMTSSSRTMAIRPGSPSSHAALPLSLPNASEPLPSKSTETSQPTLCWGCTASAPLISLPDRAAGPSSRVSPVSLEETTRLSFFDGLASGEAAWPITGCTVSCAVRPMTSLAWAGSCTSGSSTRMRSSPIRASVGSETPMASTRPRRISIARSTDSALALTSPVSLAWSMIWVPPRRSRPRRGSLFSARATQPTSRPRTSRRRTRAPRDMRHILPDVSRVTESGGHRGSPTAALDGGIRDMS